MQSLVVISGVMFILVAVFHGFVCKKLIFARQVFVGHLQPSLRSGSCELLKIGACQPNASFLEPLLTFLFMFDGEWQYAWWLILFEKLHQLGDVLDNILRQLSNLHKYECLYLCFWLFSRLLLHFRLDLLFLKCHLLELLSQIILLLFGWHARCCLHNNKYCATYSWWIVINGQSVRQPKNDCNKSSRHSRTGWRIKLKTSVKVYGSVLIQMMGESKIMNCKLPAIEKSEQSTI